MQDMSGYTLKLDPKWIVHPDSDPQGFTYFSVPVGGRWLPHAGAGACPSSLFLFDDSIPVDIHLEIPAHDVSVTLTGSVAPVVNSLSGPHRSHSGQRHCLVRPAAADVGTDRAARPEHSQRHPINTHAKTAGSPLNGGTCRFSSFLSFDQATRFSAVQNFAVHRECDHLPGDHFAAVLKGRDHSPLQPAAAGHFHPQNGHALDVVLAQDLGQLFAVIHIVQLGAADQRHFAPHELLMDIGIGIRRAVCRHQKLGPCKVGGRSQAPA